MLIEQQIEELRAELSACIDDAERAQIEAELRAARDAKIEIDRTRDELG